MTLEFLLTSMIVVLMPGTGVIYTLSCGLFQGRVASVAAAFGCTLGILPHMAASMLGLAALLPASAVAFQAVKFAGVAYLLYLAWGMWRETGTLRVNGPRAAGREPEHACRHVRQDPERAAESCGNARKPSLEQPAGQRVDHPRAGHQHDDQRGEEEFRRHGASSRALSIGTQTRAANRSTGPSQLRPRGDVHPTAAHGLSAPRPTSHDRQSARISSRSS